MRGLERTPQSYISPYVSMEDSPVERTDIPGPTGCSCDAPLKVRDWTVPLAARTLEDRRDSRRRDKT